MLPGFLVFHFSWPLWQDMDVNVFVQNGAGWKCLIFYNGKDIHFLHQFFFQLWLKHVSIFPRS